MFQPSLMPDMYFPILLPLFTYEVAQTPGGCSLSAALFPIAMCFVFTSPPPPPSPPSVATSTPAQSYPSLLLPLALTIPVRCYLCPHVTCAKLLPPYCLYQHLLLPTATPGHIYACLQPPLLLPCCLLRPLSRAMGAALAHHRTVPTCPCLMAPFCITSGHAICLCPCPCPKALTCSCPCPGLLESHLSIFDMPRNLCYAPESVTCPCSCPEVFDLP